MSKNSTGQVGDGSNVHPRIDDDSAIAPPDRSRGLGPPHPAAMVDAWPELSEATRAGIWSRVKATSTGTKLGPQDGVSKAQNADLELTKRGIELSARRGMNDRGRQ